MLFLSIQMTSKETIPPKNRIEKKKCMTEEIVEVMDDKEKAR